MKDPGGGSAELSSLWAWHGGQHFEPLPGKTKPAILPVLTIDGDSFALLSPAEAAKHKAVLDKKLASGAFDTTNRGKTVNAWSPRWLPFAYAKPIVVVIDPEGLFGGVAGQIVGVQPAATHRMLLASSLTALMRHMWSMIERGAIGIHRKKRTLEVLQRASDANDPGYPRRKNIDRLATPVESPGARRLFDVLRGRMSGSEVTAAIAAGARLDLTDASGATPLHIAAGCPNTGAAEAMLQAGAQVDARDSRGRTPLALAVATGHTRNAVEMTRLFIAAGADPDAADANGNTPRTNAAARYEVASRADVLAALTRA